MTGARADFPVALALAAGLHAAALAWTGLPGGGSRGGEAGRNAISINLVSPDVAELVETWEQVPQPAVEVPEIAAPGHGAAPTLPVHRPDPTVSRPDPPSLAAVAPAAPPQAARPLPSPEFAMLEGICPYGGKPTGAGDCPDPAGEPARLSLVARTDTFRPPRFVEKLPGIARPAPDLAPRAGRPPEPAEGPAPASRRPPGRPDDLTGPEPVARRVARGTSAAAIASDGASTGNGASAGDRRNALAGWASAIQSRIARYQVYPRGTRAEGRVRLSMVILANGRLRDVSVVRSSGVAALDRAAVRAAERAAPFPPAPKELDRKWFRVGQWVSFAR